MLYKVQYMRPFQQDQFIERTFEEFVTAREFFKQRKKTCPIVIFTETKVIEIAVKENAETSR
jgi:hypothetical protein